MLAVVYLSFVHYFVFIDELFFLLFRDIIVYIFLILLYALPFYSFFDPALNFGPESKSNSFSKFLIMAIFKI
jgi:hypothetical protein